MQFSLKSIHCIIHHWRCKNCLCISKHPNRRNISFLRLFLLQWKQFRIRRRRKGHRSLKNSGIISGKSLLIAVSFPQFFQEENRKSCCTANQNIVNGRKETVKTVHTSIAAMTDSKMTMLKAFLLMLFSIFKPAKEIR